MSVHMVIASVFMAIALLLAACQAPPAPGTTTGATEGTTAPGSGDFITPTPGGLDNGGETGVSPSEGITETEGTGEGSDLGDGSDTTDETLGITDTVELPDDGGNSD